MKTYTITPSALFYMKASVALGHAHAIQFRQHENLQVTLEDWSIPVDLLTVETVHLLHQLQSEAFHRNAPAGLPGGLVGWQETTIERVNGGSKKAYCHTTGTGRLRLWVTVGDWFSPQTTEEFGFEVKAGSGESVGVCTNIAIGSTRQWSVFAQDRVLAQNQNLIRPDRFYNVVEILYHTAPWHFTEDGKAVRSKEVQYAFPGKDLLENDNLNIGSALRSCIDGSAFEKRGQQDPLEGLDVGDIL